MPSNFQSFDASHQDEFIFAQEDEEIPFTEKTELSQTRKSWKILVVDDDIEVHDVTKLALRDFSFEGKTLTFISAYSAQEAKQLIHSHPDIAIVFLDVVMETEDAGLQLVKYIRKELDNQLVRIILRTGQPGSAPENIVAVDYEIDDYKTKIELTSQKLFISVITALRSFSTLIKMLKMIQSEPGLQVRTKQGEKAYSSAASLQAIPSTYFLVLRHEKIAALVQLMAEFAQKIDTSNNHTELLYAMSVITRIAKILLRITDEHFAKLGISSSKLAALVYLGREPDLCASPSSLAKYCGVSRAAMTGLLDGLEKAGYIERDEHPFDRRALMVKLTAKGKNFLDWLIPPEQQMSEFLTVFNEVEQVAST